MTRYAAISVTGALCLLMSLPNVIAAGAREYGWQKVAVTSASGAVCSFERDGKTLYEFTEPSREETGGEYTVKFVLFKISGSLDDITVTCKRDGYWPQSKVLVYGPSTWIADAPPCQPPKEMTPEEVNVFCSHYERSASNTIMEYPEGVSLRLKPKSP